MERVVCLLLRSVIFGAQQQFISQPSSHEPWGCAPVLGAVLLVTHLSHTAGEASNNTRSSSNIEFDPSLRKMPLNVEGQHFVPMYSS